MFQKRDAKFFKNILSGKTNAYPILDTNEANIMALSGVVMLVGNSDDLATFYGAIYDECGISRDGKIIHICKDGICDNSDNEIFCKFDAGKTTEDGRTILWTFETNIPHEELDIVDQYNNELINSRALLFDINDLKG